MPEKEIVCDAYRLDTLINGTFAPNPGIHVIRRGEIKYLDPLYEEYGGFRQPRVKRPGRELRIRLSPARLPEVQGGLVRRIRLNKRVLEGALRNTEVYRFRPGELADAALLAIPSNFHKSLCAEAVETDVARLQDGLKIENRPDYTGGLIVMQPGQEVIVNQYDTIGARVLPVYASYQPDNTAQPIRLEAEAERSSKLQAE